jgi:hypothetical protein
VRLLRLALFAAWLAAASTEACTLANFTFTVSVELSDEVRDGGT